MQFFSPKFDKKRLKFFPNWHGCGRIPNGLRKNPDSVLQYLVIKQPIENSLVTTLSKFHRDIVRNFFRK